MCNMKFLVERAIQLEATHHIGDNMLKSVILDWAVTNYHDFFPSPLTVG